MSSNDVGFPDDRNDLNGANYPRITEPGGAGGLVPFNEAAFARAQKIINAGTAENTKRAYKSDLRYIAAWAAASDFPTDFPMPAELVIRFITDHFSFDADDDDVPPGMDPLVEQELVDRKLKKPGPHAISTIERRIYALSSFHRSKNLSPNPCMDPSVKELLRKARAAAADQGFRPRKKRAITRDILDRILATCDDSVEGIRDRAMLLFAFSSGGRRRSEVADARIERLQEAPEGYVYDVGRSKANQLGNEHMVPIIGRAGDALRAWLDLVGASEGPIFRLVNDDRIQDEGIYDKLVYLVVQDRVKKAGFNPREFGGHSLRSGFLTEGGRQNVNLFRLMEMTGHSCVRTAKGYFQAGAAVQNPGALL